MTASRAEICVAACSDLFRDAGEIVASPMGTIPSIGARLARLTHAPDILFSDGESTFLAGAAPLTGEAAVVEGWIPYRRVFDIIDWGGRHVIMGAAQLDRHGNQNLSAIGALSQPKRQLLGTRGAAGNTVNNRTSYWIARHSARVFVEQVDVVTGVGPRRAAETGPSASRFNDIHGIVTNLAVLDVAGPGQTVRLASVHPGVSVEDVQAATGFELATTGDVPETRVPTAEELELIRTVIDPHQLRDSEVPQS